MLRLVPQAGATVGDVKTKTPLLAEVGVSPEKIMNYSGVIWQNFFNMLYILSIMSITVNGF
jgi:hypothetical protein